MKDAARVESLRDHALLLAGKLKSEEGEEGAGEVIAGEGLGEGGMLIDDGLIAGAVLGLGLGLGVAVGLALGLELELGLGLGLVVGLNLGLTLGLGLGDGIIVGAGLGIADIAGVGAGTGLADGFMFSGAVVGAGLGLDDIASTTITSTFCPASQWPVTPHMKKKGLVLFNDTTVAPSSQVSIGFDALQWM